MINCTCSSRCTRVSPIQVLNCNLLILIIFRTLLLHNQTTKVNEILEIHTCRLSNISSCEYTEKNKNFVVVLYNPSSQNVTTYVRLPVMEKLYQVLDHKGNVLLK